MNEAFPPIAELVPQQGRMCLLERVIAHEEDRTRCLVLPARSALFQDARGRIPAYVGIEYMTQCAAAHGGLRLRALGQTPRAGLFLGSRRLLFHVDSFDPQRRLEVHARRASGQQTRFGIESAVLDADTQETLVEGRINLLIADMEGAP